MNDLYKVEVEDINNETYFEEDLVEDYSDLQDLDISSDLEELMSFEDKTNELLEDIQEFIDSI